MSFLDRAKAAAEQVRVKAQEGVGEVQARKDLAQAYWDLGHKAQELASRGELSHPELAPLLQQISDLEARTQGSPSTTQPEQTSPSTPEPEQTSPSTPEPEQTSPSTPEPEQTSPSTPEPEQATDSTPPQSPA